MIGYVNSCNGWALESVLMTLACTYATLAYVQNKYAEVYRANTSAEPSSAKV